MFALTGGLQSLFMDSFIVTLLITIHHFWWKSTDFSQLQRTENVCLSMDLISKTFVHKSGTFIFMFFNWSNISRQNTTNKHLNGWACVLIITALQNGSDYLINFHSPSLHACMQRCKQKERERKRECSTLSWKHTKEETDEKDSHNLLIKDRLAF